MQEYTQFFLRHWMLSAAFLIVLVLLIANEIKSRLDGTRFLTVPEAIHAINHDQAIVIDLRSPEQFKQGHITDAQNFSAKQIREHPQNIDKYREQPIILVCTNGQQASGTAVALHKSGFNQVHVLKDGINAWTNSNLPLVKE